MAENNNRLLESAMRYAIPLGLFWIVRYIIFMFGTHSILLSGLALLVMPFTLVLTYYATKRFREDSGGVIRFSQAWFFGILLYFFAGLLVSIPHYIYYEYIVPPDYLANTMEQAIEMIKTLNPNPEALEKLQNMQTPSSIKMTLYDILGNIFYGIILSLPIAIVISTGGTPKMPANTNQSEKQE